MVSGKRLTEGMISVYFKCALLTGEDGMEMSAKELRSKPGQIIEQAARGNEVIITLRGKKTAKLNFWIQTGVLKYSAQSQASQIMDRFVRMNRKTGHGHTGDVHVVAHRTPSPGYWSLISSN